MPLPPGGGLFPEQPITQIHIPLYGFKNSSVSASPPSCHDGDFLPFNSSWTCWPVSLRMKSPAWPAMFTDECWWKQKCCGCRLINIWSKLRWGHFLFFFYQVKGDEFLKLMHHLRQNIQLVNGKLFAWGCICYSLATLSCRSNGFPHLKWMHFDGTTTHLTHYFWSVVGSFFTSDSLSCREQHIPAEPLR